MRHLWNGIAHCDKLQNEFFSLFKRVHLWRRTIFLIFLVFPLHLWLYFSLLNFVFFIYLSTIRLKKILFIPNPCKSEKYLFTVENIFLTRKTENFKNKIPLLASACVFLAHKEKESKVHIPLISYFVSYAKWTMGLKGFWSHIEMNVIR